MFLGGCPCCGKKGPCWRCYEKFILDFCEPQNIAAILKVISVKDTAPGYTINTSQESGLPVGATFSVLDVTENNGICQFNFEYKSPNFGEGGVGFTGISIDFSQRSFGNKIGGVTGSGLINVDPLQSFSPFINSSFNYGGGWQDTVWQGYNKHVFVAPVILDQSGFDKIGEIHFEMNVIDLAADDPDIPDDAYKYQCFENPPIEDGWTSVGKCHPDEATCAAECPPTKTTPSGGRAMTTTTGGPGTELKRLLGSFGIKSKEKGCGCKSMARRMDTKGPQWCRDNLESVILPHLAKEAAKRKLPFIKLAARRAVELAIRRAENNST